MMPQLPRYRACVRVPTPTSQTGFVHTRYTVLTQNRSQLKNYRRNAAAAEEERRWWSGAHSCLYIERGGPRQMVAVAASSRLVRSYPTVHADNQPTTSPFPFRLFVSQRLPTCNPLKRLVYFSNFFWPRFLRETDMFL